MPHVASDPKTYALNHPLPLSPRPPQAADRVQGTPFESLLDDGAQAPAERPAPSAADDKSSPAARSEPAKSPEKATGSTAAKSSDNAKPADAGKGAKTGKSEKSDNTATAAGDGKTIGKDKAAADAKTAELAAAGQAAAGDASKPVSDGKPADGVTPDGLAAAPPADPIATITTADAIVTALAPAPDAVSQAAPDAVSQAAPAAQGKVAIIATPKATPDTLAALQASPEKQAAADKSADQSTPAVKTAPQLHTDGKPQPVAGEADKDSIAQDGGEAPANNHRAATVEAPAAIGIDANAAAPKTPADAAPAVALTAPSHTTAASAANPAAATPPLPQAAAIPLAGVAIEIAGKALAGKNRFEIRLDPPELGRIEVRLDVDRDGNVTSRMVVDRADTLDLLRRDAAGLERALQDAGLKTADNSLQFSLRDQTMSRDQANSATPGAVQLVVDDDALAAADLNQRGYSRLAGQGSGIDIHV